jgi:integrase
MAREKGMGSLQLEKSGRWTMRVGIKGKRYSRSTRTTDREKAEKFLERFLSPLGLGSRRLPLADVWLEYVKSPDRRDLAPSTLNAKRLVWMDFARWMEHHHLEIGNLAEVTHEAIAEYLACIRAEVCASTYNARICVLREIFHVLAAKAGLIDDPWEGVRLHADDCHSRRELTLDEIERLMKAAAKAGGEWKRLFTIGIYTGLRLGDCCCLAWNSVNLERGMIQLIPTKTRKHAHGQPVTIPIHPQLHAELEAALARDHERRACAAAAFVNPMLADYYKNSKWRISHGLELIFKAAHIETSVKLEGRRTRTPEATFHSLRHTFVSLAANAGVPLPVVQSIVGHSSAAMTRHYYHENEDVLRQAVAAIPAIGERGMGNGEWSGRGTGSSDRINKIGRIKGQMGRSASVPARLKRLDKYLAQGLITQEEHDVQRARMLAEL